MIQPLITKKPVFKTIVINSLLIIIPFGVLYVLFKVIEELTVTRIALYKKEYVKKRDKRYKTGYKIVGTIVKKSSEKRELSQEEIFAIRYNGKLRVYAIVIILIIGVLLHLFNN